MALVNSAMDVAPRYLRLIRDITIKVHVKCYKDGLPREEFLRIQSALSKFAERLTTGHSLLKFTIIYLEQTGDITRARSNIGNYELQARIYREWNGKEVINREYLAWTSVDKEAIDEAISREVYYQILEPLGLIHGVRHVKISSGNEDFNQRLTRAIQSQTKVCKPIFAMETRVVKVRGRKQIKQCRVTGRKWFESKYDFLLEAPSGEQQSNRGASPTS
ncbi:hypothetical protein MMC14_004843 [Varicellaria rhodocarpa]|nr:hypothetical protein [Varicellaria rhodocarpa]